MASGSAVAVYSSTLVASTVDTVTLGYNFRVFEVVNTGTTAIYVSTDGVTAPTVAGAEFDVIPPNSSAILSNRQPPNEVVTNFNLASQPDHTHGDTTTSVTVVKLISSSTPTYTVSGRPLQRGV